MEPVTWREAWHEALYAAGSGFYVAAGGPVAHFATAASGPAREVLAAALLRLVDHRPQVIVDVGAGRGELATALLHAAQGILPEARPLPPDIWGDGYRQGDIPPPRYLGGGGVRVVAVDVTPRPPELDPRVEWLRSPGGPDLPADLRDLDDALVVAHEWLDVVPCTIAEVGDDGTLREVLVDPRSGAESPGAPVDGPDRDWATAHWPPRGPGDRIEIGRSRDEAWSALVDRVRSGVLVAVDYGHTRASRPAGGTLTAYRRGRETRPVPDGSCDLTAHVAMDSLEHDDLVTQRDALRRLGLTGRPPELAGAASDPAAYLVALERSTHEAHLIAPGGYGAFWWAVRRIPANAVP
ncbi:MAG TPA: SAM-dependent methyltransferase [Intrasporangium sp.]|uniref:SAM-dependent methyltransferase n=1 Tax=Intrasporangium sp. TaxID=1925024 RepID=UPI002D7A230A|nr:SAM-dependent methyltransferase [Intrasporangium sp.]HET7399453.1 SAM-dependent methyltransferase [Intrasporangium sp.]